MPHRRTSILALAGAAGLAAVVGLGLMLRPPVEVEAVQSSSPPTPDRDAAPSDTPAPTEESSDRSRRGPRPIDQVADDDRLIVPLLDKVHLHFSPPPGVPEAVVEDMDDRTLGQMAEITLDLPPYPGPNEAKRILARITVEPILLETDDPGLRRPADPWTRAGYLSVLTPSQDVKQQSVTGDAIAPGGRRGADASSVQEPVEIELFRFVTPYGGPATFIQDVSAFAPLLTGDDATLRLTLTTYASPGWLVSAQLEYLDQPPGVRRPARVIPLFHDQEVMASTPPLAATVTIADGLAAPRLRILSTGHAIDGQDGDEFITRVHTLRIDGRIVARWRPWAEDGARLRSMNPMAGRVEIEGRTLWSSDLDRSGWHPGRPVPPLIIPLPELAPGEHDISLTIANIRPPDSGDPQAPYGYWRTSAVLLLDEPWPDAPAPADEDANESEPPAGADER